MANSVDRYCSKCYNTCIDSNKQEKKMSELIEVVAMPVCPYCKTAMRPQYFTGYYDSFPCWACECDKLPDAEEVRGAYA